MADSSKPMKAPAPKPRETTSPPPAIVVHEAEPTGPPKWLDAAFFHKALTEQEFHIESLEIEDAVGVGENYATKVYRVKLNTSIGEIPLIVKCLPESEFRAKMIRDGDFTIREVRMYQETLPMLRGSLKTPHYPMCLYTLLDETRDTLVLQDLRPKGFRTTKRHLGLNEAHCRLALTELAHLHGLSAAMRIQQPEKFKTEIMDKYPDKLFDPTKKDITMSFMRGMMKGLSEAIKKNFPFRFRAIADLMERFVEEFFDEVVDCLAYPADPTSKVLVLNHGDFWSNNMLFRYEEGNPAPQECFMVDFQIARYAAPVMDLQYFFFSSTEQATRKAHMDSLLEHYLQEARWAMAQRGVTNPGQFFYKNVAEIKEDIRRHAAFGFISGAMVMPIVVADPEAAPDLDKFTTDDLQKEEITLFPDVYSGPRFCKLFREILEDFDDMGFFKYVTEKWS